MSNKKNIFNPPKCPKCGSPAGQYTEDFIERHHYDVHPYMREHSDDMIVSVVAARVHPRCICSNDTCGHNWSLRKHFLWPENPSLDDIDEEFKEKGWDKLQSKEEGEMLNRSGPKALFDIRADKVKQQNLV